MDATGGNLPEVDDARLATTGLTAAEVQARIAAREAAKTASSRLLSHPQGGVLRDHRERGLARGSVTVGGLVLRAVRALAEANGAVASLAAAEQ